MFHGAVYWRVAWGGLVFIRKAAYIIAKPQSICIFFFFAKHHPTAFVPNENRLANLRRGFSRTCEGGAGGAVSWSRPASQTTNEKFLQKNNFQIVFSFCSLHTIAHYVGRRVLPFCFCSQDHMMVMMCDEPHCGNAPMHRTSNRYSALVVTLGPHSPISFYKAWAA